MSVRPNSITVSSYVLTPLGGSPASVLLGSPSIILPALVNKHMNIRITQDQIFCSALYYLIFFTPKGTHYILSLIHSGCLLITSNNHNVLFPSVMSYSIFQASLIKTPEAPSCLIFASCHSKIMESGWYHTDLINWIESFQLTNVLLWNFAVYHQDYHKPFFSRP